MARRHMLRDRRVLVRDARTHVARNPLALVEDLNRAVREAYVNGLPQQSERHRVVMVIDLDVIVRRDRAALPLGILVALAWQPFQRRPVESGKKIVAALLQLLHHLGVDLRYAVANGVVQLDQGEEGSSCTLVQSGIGFVDPSWKPGGVKSRRSNSASPISGGIGHVIPTTLARLTYSQTAVLPTPVASRTWRTVSPSSCVSRSTSRIFLIDILIPAIGCPCCSRQGLPIC